MQVWAVDLVRGASTRDRAGSLILDETSLRFEPEQAGEPELTVPLRELERVRRLRGSPVLVISFLRGSHPRKTAFYFVPPPPLTAFSERHEERNAFTALRNPKRKARRDNVGYLGMLNRAKKDEIVAWERAIRAAAAGARGT